MHLREILKTFEKKKAKLKDNMHHLGAFGDSLKIFIIS